MAQNGKYLYCIIRCGDERAFGDAVPVGGESGPVYSLTHQGLAVVASDACTDQYDITRANMLAHQRVQESVMQGFTVLPVRFGTVAKGASPIDDVRRLLEKRRPEFEQLLSEMDGKTEVGLKALWKDESAVFEGIVAQDNKIRALRDSLRGKPPQATHFDRVRLGEMVKVALERRRTAEASALLAPLRRIACRMVENPVMVDRMVVNAAFLVEKQREEEFDQAVGRLDREHGQRVIFKYVGPVPPYNFVNIVVNWLDL
jgi:hypothetical protein